MRLVEKIYLHELKSDFKTRYLRYRTGRVKHRYWLWNRKKANKIIDRYDAVILKNCQPGRTAFFASAGYYLKEIWPDIDSIETHTVVKEFNPDVILVPSRAELSTTIPYKYDNFAVVNHRTDHWVDISGLTEHLTHYCTVLNPGARVFYSFRDTQIHYNRLKIKARDHFLTWAHSLKSIGLELVWHDFQFKIPVTDPAGNYDTLENPDAGNGNLKFWFVYKGTPWTPIL